MAEVLNALRLEHQNIARLLDLLERQLALFDEAKRPDYDVLLGIADYFSSFPDRCHHPKEDLIYRKLVERDPEAAKQVGDMASDHEALGQRVVAFRGAVRNVLGEAEVPRSVFDSVLRDFITEQRQHMEMENKLFFPAAIKALTDADWAEIDAEISPEQDPLFGPDVAAEFETLLEDVLRWEREDQAADS